MTYQEIEVVRREREREFRDTTAPAIAAELAMIEPAAGWRWVPGTEDNHQRAGLFDNAGASIWFRFDSMKQRVDVHGAYPNMPDGTGWFPRRHEYKAADVSIGCSVCKPVHAIARDIARRFLPEYRKFLGWAAEDIAQQQQWHNSTRATFDAILAAGGDVIKADAHRNGQRVDATGTDTLMASFVGMYGSVRVSGDSVRIEIDVKRDQAIAIVAALKGGR